jgi:PBP1b-binding outer membrane lipoprotein LpoB
MKMLHRILALLAAAGLFAGCATSNQARSDSSKVRTAHLVSDQSESPAASDAGWTIGSPAAEKP